MNLYRYVGNEATGAIDPAGLEEEGQAFEGELWTFSGISNWDEERKKYVDYVGKLLASAGIGIKKSDQPFMSKLGIGPHYRGSKDVYSYVSSEYRLDFEARSMMKDVDIEKIKSDKPRIDIYLVAPKTDTCVTPESLREKGFDVRITILWSPWDDVPNQSLGELPGRSYWEKLGDDVYTVIPYLNYGVSYSQHEFLAYLEGPLRSAYLHRYLVPRTM